MEQKSIRFSDEEWKMIEFIKKEKGVSGNEAVRYALHFCYGKIANKEEKTEEDNLFSELSSKQGHTYNAILYVLFEVIKLHRGKNLSSLDFKNHKDQILDYYDQAKKNIEKNYE